MSYNGSGTFLINTAGQPVVSGTVISSTAFNALTADLATGLSTAITKDGQTTVTANIPMANYKFTGLGAGSAAADSANLSQVQSTVVKLLASVSGTDTITAVGSPTVAAYAAGQMFYFVAAGDNTGAVTINIDSLGAKNVTRDGSVALAAGDIKSGEVVVIVYDGTRFQVVSQLNSSGDARFANVSIASALNVGGVATFSAGTAAAPAITTTGDTNTGIFFPAADTIAFAEGGAEAARIDSAGNLLVGTTSVVARLTITDSSATTTTNLGFFSGSSSNGGLAVRTDTSNRIAILQSAGTNSGISFNTNSGGTEAERGRFTPAGDFCLGGTSATTSNGSVSRIFAINGTNNNVIVGTTDTANRAFIFEARLTGRSGNARYAQIGMENDSSNNANIQFLTAPSGSDVSERMRLDASGNLGVGQTSPTTRIHVKGANTAARGQLTVEGDGGSPRITLYDGTTFVGTFTSSGSLMQVGAEANIPLALLTNGTERGRFTAGGYFKASNDGNYLGSTGSYHELRTTITGDWTARTISASTTGNIYGHMSQFSGQAPNNATSLFFVGTDTVGDRFIVYSNGGIANYQANDANLSDERTKTDIKPVGSYWDKIKAIEIVTFKYKDQTHDDDNVGVIAQQVESVAPEFVNVDGFGETPEDGVPLKTIYTTDMYHAAIKALQEAMARIEQLETKVAALESK